MQKWTQVLAVALGMGVVLGALPAGAIPVQVPYSGQLAENGELVNSTMTMQFQIVTAGGVEQYDTEAIQVTITNGAFSVLLGGDGLPPLDSQVFATPGLKLRVTVDGESLGDVDLPFSPYAAGGDHSSLQNLGADTHNQYLNRSGVRPMTGDLDMNDNALNGWSQLASGTGVLRYNSSTNKFEVQSNGGSFAELTTQAPGGGTDADLLDGFDTATALNTSSARIYVSSASTGLLPDSVVGSGTIANGAITNADINNSAAIADTKLATISTAGKVADSALSSNIPRENASETITSPWTFSGNISANGGISLGSQTLSGTTAVIDFNNFDVAGGGNTTIGGALTVSGVTSDPGVNNRTVYGRDGISGTTGGNDFTVAFPAPASNVTVTIPGTTGTVITSGDTGTVTGAMIANGASGVSLTQDVTGTLPVGNGGTGATTLTTGGVLFGNGTSAITNSGVLSNGQLLIGDGSGAPTASTLTGTSDEVTVTNGSGSIVLSLPNNAGTDISADLEEESQIRSTNVSDNAASAQLLIGTGTNAASWVGLMGDLSIASNGTTTIETDSVALATDTTGSYVESVATVDGLTGGAGGTEARVLSLGLDYSATLANNPGLASNRTQFASTGVIFEGSTANTLEGLLTAENPTADRTWTLPDSSGTVITTGNLNDITDTGTLGATTINGTLTLQNSETLDTSTDATFTFGRNTGGTVTLQSADNNANADLTVRPGGTGVLTLGSGATPSLTVTTDGTGDAEVALPDQSISSTEILNGTIVNADLSSGSFSNITGVGTLTALTVDGTTNLNANNNAATNIGTGTTTSAVSIGGGANTVAVNSTSWDVSTGGAFTGVASLTGSGALTVASTNANLTLNASSATLTLVDVTNSGAGVAHLQVEGNASLGGGIANTDGALVVTLTADSAIAAGDAVTFEGTTTAGRVAPAATGDPPVGVALAAAASAGDPVIVAVAGIVEVNADDAAAGSVDAGEAVSPSGTAGTVDDGAVAGEILGYAITTAAAGKATILLALR